MSKAEFCCSHKDKRIAIGPDTSVYRFGDFVLKFYPQLSFHKLLQYQQFTNQIAMSLVHDPISGNIIIQDKEWKIQYSVVPIEEVVEYECPQAKSRYIAGPTSFSLLSWIGRAVKAPLDIRELNDINERDFLYNLLLLLEQKDFCKYFVRSTATDELLERVHKETDIEGLETISRVNAKLRADTRQRVLHIIVTDLCGHISSLEFPIARMGSEIQLPAWG